ncbi:MAG: glycosyltransferase [Pirellulaceae bacterium]|nr:glycosyltransferase [Pirellulaceae bacterium]
MMTTESVSVVLSVENAQSWLAADLRELMDCLADLSSRFEIIVIDNASRDYTFEILEDMHNRFPQVRFRHFANRQVVDDAMQAGMAMAQGDFIFTTEAGSRIEPADIRRLWALRSDPKLLVARSRTTARRVDAGLINRLTQWAQRVTAHAEPVVAQSESFGGLQMMRRDAMEKLQPMHLSPANLATPATALAPDASIEVSHISHQQLASPKLVDSRRRASVQP